MMFPGVGLPFLAHALLSLAQLLPPRRELIQKNVRGLFLHCGRDAHTAASAFMHPMKAKPAQGVFVNGPARQSMANRPGVNGSRKQRVATNAVCKPQTQNLVPQAFCFVPENHTAEAFLSFFIFHPLCNSECFTPRIHYTRS